MDDAMDADEYLNLHIGQLDFSAEGVVAALEAHTEKARIEAGGGMMTVEVRFPSPIITYIMAAEGISLLCAMCVFSDAGGSQVGQARSGTDRHISADPRGGGRFF